MLRTMLPLNRIKAKEHVYVSYCNNSNKLIVRSCDPNSKVYGKIIAELDSIQLENVTIYHTDGQNSFIGKYAGCMRFSFTEGIPISNLNKVSYYNFVMIENQHVQVQ